MLYTEMTKKAMKLMAKYHGDQPDKTGLPYILHPWHVAEQMEREDEIIVALLHDIVEDTECTLEVLESAGFSDRVLAAVDVMTHRKGVPYQDYVELIAKNPLAAKVKLADLRHNSTLERLDEVTEEDLKRKEKYQKAIERLEQIDR